MVYFVQFDFEIGYGIHFEISNHIWHAVSILNGDVVQFDVEIQYGMLFEIQITYGMLFQF